MTYHGLIFYETPDGKIPMVSHKKSKGFVTLRINEKEDGAELPKKDANDLLKLKPQEGVYTNLDTTRLSKSRESSVITK